MPTRGRDSRTQDFFLAPPYAPNSWYAMQPGGSLAAGAVLVADSIRLQPFMLRSAAQLAAVGARITTLAAGGVIQLGLYAADRNLRPTGAPIYASASQPTDAAGLVSVPIAQINWKQLPRGIYWFGINADANAAGTAIMQAISGGSVAIANLIGAAALASVSGGAAVTLTGLAFAQTFGTWPDLTGRTFTELSSGDTAAGFFLTAP